jgi:hypothetical protein
MPIHALKGHKGQALTDVQKALVDWVKAAAPTVPKPLLPYRGRSVSLAKDTAGIPLPVLLHRFEPVLIPDHNFAIKHITGGEQGRVDRMKRAIDKKFPKLAGWKRDEGARTILVLEDNDIQLTNPSIVADTFLPLAEASQDRPDETYLVMSCLDPWHASPILIADKSYFDLAKKPNANILWQIDQNALTSLTK